MGFNGAASRLIELGERKRGAQFEAARRLVFRDCDGDLKCFLRSRGAGGIALEQHFATDAIEFGVECALANPFGCVTEITAPS